MRTGNAGALGAALSLAAAPTFAIMAVLTGVAGGNQADMLCSAGQAMSPLSGMVPMYLLMSAFHLGPWLTLASRRHNDILRAAGAGRVPDEESRHTCHSHPSTTGPIAEQTAKHP